MDLSLGQIAQLDQQAAKVLKANKDAEMSGFLEDRQKLIDKYENQIDWFSHVGIESIELQNVCKKLRASIIDYVIVIVVHNEDSHLNTFLFASEDLKEFFGVYTEVD